MMYLRTGTPGAGKTLSTIDEVNKRAIEECRDVYYTNISELILDGWTELSDGSTWHDEIPNGAIYVCDEFYEVFPRTGKKGNLPDHYELLAKHRHRGLDVYLICQGIQQIEPFLLPLFENHHHLIRSEMRDVATKFKRKGYMPKPELRTYRKDCEMETYKFNKDLYGSYKSADTHTYKKRIPKIVKHLFIATIVLLALLFMMFRFFLSKTSSEDVSQTTTSEVIDEQFKQDSSFSIGNSGAVFNPLVDYKPRIAAMPETAPAYDDLRRPVTVPKPTCLMTLDRCLCYTQQATLMHDYPDVLCRSYVKNGRFDPTKPDRTKSSNNRNSNNFIRSSSKQVNF